MDSIVGGVLGHLIEILCLLSFWITFSVFTVYIFKKWYNMSKYNPVIQNPHNIETEWPPA